MLSISLSVSESTKRLCLVTLALSATLGCPRVSDPLSTFNVGDPKAANQLLWGFWGIEAKPSRWVAQDFSFYLRPPQPSSAKGAKLWMRLFIPDSQIAELGPMTLTAKVDQYSLRPQTFSSG